MSLTDSSIVHLDGTPPVDSVKSVYEVALGQYSTSIHRDIVQKRRYSYQQRDDKEVFSENQDHLALAQGALNEFRQKNDPAVLRDRARSAFALVTFAAVADTLYRRGSSSLYTPLITPDDEDYGALLGTLVGWTANPQPTKFMSSKYHQWTTSLSQPASKSKWPPKHAIVLSYWHYIALMTLPETANFFANYKTQIAGNLFMSDMPESYHPYETAYQYVVNIWKDSVGLTQPYTTLRYKGVAPSPVEIGATADSFWDCYFDFLFLALLNTGLCQIFANHRAPKALPFTSDGLYILSDIGMGAFIEENSMYTYNANKVGKSAGFGNAKCNEIADLAKEVWWSYVDH